MTTFYRSKPVTPINTYQGIDQFRRSLRSALSLRTPLRSRRGWADYPPLPLPIAYGAPWRLLVDPGGLSAGAIPGIGAGRIQTRSCRPRGDYMMNAAAVFQPNQ